MKNKTCIAISIIVAICSLPCKTSAGLACLSDPCLNGICIDDINGTYSCYCIDGFTGIRCQTNWDECWSNPCKNGGTCIDGIAEFNCTCPEGFVGEECDIDFDECDSNPCQNNGTCVDGVDEFSCLCPVGYSGSFCEIDEAVCDTTEDTKCYNGGRCVEGPGTSFFCRCARGWEGKLCLKETNECLSSPCKNGGICIDEHADYYCACPFGYTGKSCESTIELCKSNPCKNDALCIMENDVKVCYCVPDYHGERCQYQYDECALGPRCMNGGTCIDGVDNFTCSCPPMLTGMLCECLIIDGEHLDCEYTSPSPLPTVSESSSVWTTESKPTETTWYSRTRETTPYTQSSTLRDTSESSTSIIKSSTDSYTVSTSKFEESSTTERTLASSPTSTEYERTSTTQGSGVYERTSTTQGSGVYETSTLGIESRFGDTTEYQTTIASTEYRTTIVSTVESIDLRTATTSYLPENATISTQSIPFTITAATTVVANATGTTIEDILDITEFPSVETWTTTYAPESTEKSTTESSRCFQITCFNGGTCVETANGPKCVCKFDYDGAFCETTLGVASAAFGGDSYVSHELHETSGMNVHVKVRTFSSRGLILYANIGRHIYMCLYVHDGLLRFKFSCGYQTMLLSELENPVNNGYELDIKAILKLTDGGRHCNASLHLNETLAMSGGQMVSAFYPSSKDSLLHLGSIPDAYKSIHRALPDVESFTGCMFGLRIDNKPRHIFNDAIDGFEIKECSSLVCLSNPCTNGGTCNDSRGKWSCSCPNGYLGEYCEESVCATNPCNFGGTCVRHPGSGFLCLCPLGKHGLYCEHNLEITRPSFSSMVNGLSSFAVYRLPNNLVSRGVEIRFRIKPDNLNQISLLAFMGQSGVHDPKSDHLAVTFVKGYIMLTWNLGNGPRRIFTSRPITVKNGKSHFIRIGRIGRSAWLSVDNMQNITGNAPGNLINLDVIPLLFIGGHDSINFTSLPHDLPLHGGFSGCIWDLWIGNIGSKSNGVTWNPIRGRAVGQCGVTQCHSMACHNNGACLHHSATFSCLCTEGRFGPICANDENPCDTGNNKCVQGSTCVPTISGYQCDCPLGKYGIHCENDTEISDVSFSGVRSYLRLNVPPPGDVHFSVEFEVKPLHPKGVLFYTESADGYFISLSLQGGVLEYRWAGREWGGNQIGNKIVIVVRSGVVLSLGSWHMIKAGRYGRRLFLWVDGTVTVEMLTSHHFLAAFNTSLYIGGVPDLSTLPPDTASGHPTPFTGCIRKFSIDSEHFPMNKHNILESRNVNDCDGDVCGGDICWNGGTCVIVEKEKERIPECVCKSPYAGPHCFHMTPCKENQCNGGKCVRGACVCPNGRTGHACQHQIQTVTPRFKGDGYIGIDENKIVATHQRLTQAPLERVRRIFINFTTTASDGLLLWSEYKGNKSISVGLESGYLKIGWAGNARNESSPESGTIKILQAGRLSNGDWHSLDVKFQTTNVTIITDGKLVYEENGIDYERDDSKTLLYIGGFPHGETIRRRTGGLYSSNFIGCIAELTFGSDLYSQIRDFSQFQGENIESCNNYVF